MLKEAKVAFAVSVGSFKQCGCPFCGSQNGTAHGRGGEAVLWSCCCGQPFVILAENVTRSPIRLCVDGQWVTPSLRPHPRLILTVPDPVGIIKTDEPPAQDLSDRAE